MKSRGEMIMDPGALQSPGATDEIEIVVPYTEWEITSKVLQRVEALTAGLNARISLIAVHSIPYPAPFACPISIHAHLVEQLLDLASQCSLPVNAQVVLARSSAEGFSHSLPPESLVLLGSRKRFYRTYEERLGRMLAGHGHHVSLLHVD